DYFGVDYASPPDQTGEFKLTNHKRVFRVIASSGEVFEIKRGEVYVNHIHVPLPPNAKMEYEVDAETPIEDFEKLPLSDYLSDKPGDTLKYYVQLTIREAAAYRANVNILKVNKYFRQDVNDSFCARFSSQGSWTSDDYGPVRIPSPGDSIEVNEINYKFFHNI